MGADELVANQSDAQSGHLSIRELERLRDDNLVGIMRALRRSGSGAGGTLVAHEASFPAPLIHDLPITVDRRVPQTWTDYNVHMNEANYLEAGAQATDRFMEMIGSDADYISNGSSYFTVESHVRFISELKEGDMLKITTQVLMGNWKKMHLVHRMYGPDGGLAATSETMLVHMDLAARQASLPEPQVAACLAEFKDQQASMGIPDGAGRHVGAPLR